MPSSNDERISLLDLDEYIRERKRDWRFRLWWWLHWPKYQWLRLRIKWRLWRER